MRPPFVPDEPIPGENPRKGLIFEAVVRRVAHSGSPIWTCKVEIKKHHARLMVYLSEIIAQQNLFFLVVGLDDPHEQDMIVKWGGDSVQLDGDSDDTDPNPFNIDEEPVEMQWSRLGLDRDGNFWVEGRDLDSYRDRDSHDVISDLWSLAKVREYWAL